MMDRTWRDASAGTGLLDRPTLSAADRAAHEAAQGPVRTSRPPKPQRRVLERFSAGGPRGSWPAEEFAADRRREGLNVDVVMDLDLDAFLVVTPGEVQS